jgi:hypothetical protein
MFSSFFLSLLFATDTNNFTNQHQTFLTMHQNTTTLPAVECNETERKLGLKPLSHASKQTLKTFLPQDQNNGQSQLMNHHLQMMQAKQLARFPSQKTVPSNVAVSGFLTCAVLNQGVIGNCTAYSLGYIINILKKLKISKRYQYTNTCLTEYTLYGGSQDPQGYLDSDPGASLLGSLVSCYQNNVTPETVVLPQSLGSLSGNYTGCTYNATGSNFSEVLPPFSQQIALKLQKIGNTPNPYLNAMQNLKYKDLLTPYTNNQFIVPAKNQTLFGNALISELQSGRMLYVGVLVYSSFFNAPNGVISMPKTSEKLEGGHALALGAYNNDLFQFINSWGASWGKQGFGFLSIPYLMNYSVEIYSVSM